MRRRSCCLALGCLLSPALAQTFAPLGRPWHVGEPSAYDTARRRLVMLGDDGSTWELDGGTLLPRANLSGTPTPPARINQTMCYDEARRHVLLFSGQTAVGTPVSLINDTWIYDGSRWTQLTAGPTPAARRSVAITWDSARNRVLMWGGQNTGILSDTWEHNGTNWVQRTPATTPGPNSGVMTFDRQRGVAVLATPNGFTGGGVDTWEWNGTNWTLRAPASSGPNTNGNATMAFDPLRNRTVLAGGIPNDRIWEWDGTSWTASAPLPQPFLRLDAASWFDPGCGCITIAGGIEYQLQSGGGSQAVLARSDQWQWNGQVLTQSQAQVGPRSQFDAVMIPDPLRGRVLHFGGSTNVQLFGETWSLAGGAWSLVPSVGPSPRAGSAAAYDLALGEGLLFGGVASGTFLGDTWSIAGSGWVARSTLGPPARANAAMAADLVRGIVVLFGGQVGLLGSSIALLDDTWEWNGTIWTPRPTGVRPPARMDAAMAFHPQLGRIMLFGGRTGFTLADQRNDTWTWDGTQWAALAPATVPPSLGLVSMSTNLTTNRCTLVGATGALTALRQQVWSHDGSNWVQVLDQPAPVVNRWFPCTFGPTFDTLLCTGTTSGAAATEVTFLPGRVATLGAGCGTPAATLLVRSRPRVGATTGLELVANPGRAVLFALDLTSGNTPIGGGCTVWLGPGFLGLFQVSDTSGFAAQPLSLPANPSLRGLDLFGQAAVLEPLSSNGLVLTQGLRLTLGD